MKRIDLQGLPSDTSLRELLTRLEARLPHGAEVCIDLSGTDLVFVKSASCVHCDRAIPIELPLSRYTPAPYRCARCEDVCVHAYEPSESYVKTITSYSRRSSSGLLGTAVGTLGLDGELSFSVTEKEDGTYIATPLLSLL